MTNKNTVCILCILENQKEGKAWKGKSNTEQANRELPAGERRMWKLYEYIPELRTEQIRLQ